jgi:hypothetical protein
MRALVVEHIAKVIEAALLCAGLLLHKPYSRSELDEAVRRAMGVELSFKWCEMF